MNKKPPIRANMLVLKQILNLILRELIKRHTLETGVAAKARTFSVLNYLSPMLFTQFFHAMGLNDVYDWTNELAKFARASPRAKSSCFTRPMWVSSTFSI